MIEVTFFLPSYREVLREAARLLQPGGVFFVAFRSQYYNLLQSIRARLWEGADLVLAQREGRIFGGAIWFTWQTPMDIQRVLADSGLVMQNMRGIGVCSGIAGDPLAVVARPSRLSPSEQERLMNIECAVAEAYAACGRYILVSAAKSPQSPGHTIRSAYD